MAQNSDGTRIEFRQIDAGGTAGAAGAGTKEAVAAGGMVGISGDDRAFLMWLGRGDFRLGVDKCICLAQVFTGWNGEDGKRDG